MISSHSSSGCRRVVDPTEVPLSSHHWLPPNSPRLSGSSRYHHHRHRHRHHHHHRHCHHCHHHHHHHHHHQQHQQHQQHHQTQQHHQHYQHLHTQHGLGQTFLLVHDHNIRVHPDYLIRSLEPMGRDQRARQGELTLSEYLTEHITGHLCNVMSYFCQSQDDHSHEDISISMLWQMGWMDNDMPDNGRLSGSFARKEIFSNILSPGS